MSADTVIHRIVRPVVRLIAPTRVTPNHITTLRLLTGIAAAVALGAGNTVWLMTGAAIFLLSMLLDRADGELARQTGQSSVGGHRYDLASDCFSNIIAFIGIGIGQMERLGLLALMLGFAAGIAIGVLFWQLHVLRIGQVRGYRLAPGILIDPDDLLVFVPLLIWAGATVPMLFAAAIVTPVAALWLSFTGLRRKDDAPGL